MKQNGFGVIPSCLITDTNMSDEAVTVYTILRTYNYVTDIDGYGHSIFTMKYLNDLLSINIKHASKIMQVKQTIQMLLNEKFLEFYLIECFETIKITDLSQVGRKTVFIKFPKEVSDESRVVIPIRNLNKILLYIYNQSKIKKFKFIRYYLLIARACSNENHSWSLSKSYFTKKQGLSRGTCLSWNKILQDLGLIYFCSSDKEYNSPTKFYHCMYENCMTKEEFEKMMVDDTTEYN